MDPAGLSLVALHTGPEPPESVCRVRDHVRGAGPGSPLPGGFGLEARTPDPSVFVPARPGPPAAGAGAAHRGAQGCVLAPCWLFRGRRPPSPDPQTSPNQ